MTNYDTEVLKRELGKLGYKSFRVRDGVWGIEHPSIALKHGLWMGTTEEQALLGALEHARGDKALTGAKIAAIGMSITIIPTDVGCYACTDFHEAKEKDWDLAINALWEKARLRGGAP